jgi:hypothetical protein
LSIEAIIQNYLIDRFNKHLLIDAS